MRLHVSGRRRVAAKSGSSASAWVYHLPGGLMAKTDSKDATVKNHEKSRNCCWGWSFAVSRIDTGTTAQ